MGRDAKSNDYLTFNLADKEDIWMHAKGVPGSHVVIRVRENLPTDDVIRFAAEIAKKE
jgi:predicted ribosome quality control (RQC) complex YloA/Tae2 family protein